MDIRQAETIRLPGTVTTPISHLFHRYIFRVYFIYDKKPQLCCTRFPAAFIHPRGYPLAPAASPILRFKNAISVRFSISPRSFARSCNSSDRPREIFHVSCLHLERKQSSLRKKIEQKRKKEMGLKNRVGLQIDDYRRKRGGEGNRRKG